MKQFPWRPDFKQFRPWHYLILVAWVLIPLEGVWFARGHDVPAWLWIATLGSALPALVVRFPFVGADTPKPMSWPWRRNVTAPAVAKPQWPVRWLDLLVAQCLVLLAAGLNIVIDGDNDHGAILAYAGIPALYTLVVLGMAFRSGKPVMLDELVNRRRGWQTFLTTVLGIATAFGIGFVAPHTQANLAVVGTLIAVAIGLAVNTLVVALFLVVIVVSRKRWGWFSW